MSEEEAKAALEKTKAEYLDLKKKVKDLLNVFVETLDAIQGPNEIGNRLLVASKLESYAARAREDLEKRVETTLLLQGMSKTGAKKAVLKMIDIQKQIVI